MTEYKPPPPPSDDGKHGGRRPQGPRAMTDAERQAAYRRRKAEDRVKALARAAMFKWEYENLVGRYGKAVVRKGPEKRVRRGPQRSRRVTGHLMAEAEADLECRRRVKRELLAAFYTLAKTVQEIVMRANIDDEGFERLTDLLEVLDKGVYTMADAEALGFRHEAIVTEYKPPPPPSDDAPKKRSRSAGEDESLIRQWVRPELGGRKVVDVGHRDVERLHAKISKGTPTRANRIAALLSKAFALAITWEWRPDNPCRGLQKNREQPRQRYLSGDELRRLMAALADFPNQAVANAVRLLLLTGCRKGELLAAEWSQFDLKGKGVWMKPSSATKQGRSHRIPLNTPARQLLAEIKSAADRRVAGANVEPSKFVFPARTAAGHMIELKGAWARICRQAGLDGVRVHDLRHSYASILASAGLSLPIIGALLGHSQPGTTHRYSHLLDDPLRAATERAGAIVTGNGDDKPAAQVVDMRRR